MGVLPTLRTLRYHLTRSLNSHPALHPLTADVGAPKNQINTIMENISLRGTASAVSTIYVNRREYHTFLLICSEKGNYRVYVRHEDTEWDLEDGEHYSANGFEVADGIIIATSVDRWGRICDVCGKWHTEGYYISECNYACSEECALTYYGGDKAEFEKDLALLDNPETADDADTYWTAWD